MLRVAINRSLAAQSEPVKCAIQGKRVGSDDMEDLRHRSHNFATLQKRIGGNMETIMRDSRCRARWRQLVRGAARTADRDS